MDSLTYNISAIAGPTLTAMVATTAGAAVASMALAASAGWGAACMLFLRTAAPRSGGGHAPIGAGLIAIARVRQLRAVTTATGIAQRGSGALPVVAAVIAEPIGAPLKTGAAAAGAALAGLLSPVPAATPLPVLAAAPVAAGLLGALLLSRPGRPAQELQPAAAGKGSAR